MLADAAPDELVDRAVQHLGERAVGVDDRRVVEADERHAGGRRVERLLEPAPGLLERPHALLALGDVAQAHDRARPGTSSSGSRRGRSSLASTATVVPSARARRSVIGPGDSLVDLALRQPHVEVDAGRRLDELAERPPDERVVGAPVSSAALALTPRTTRSSSSDSTASGRSSSSRRSSPSVSTSRSIVRLSWPVDAPRLEPRDHHGASAERSGGDRARSAPATVRPTGRRRVPSTVATSTASTMSRPAANTTDTTHRHVEARRRRPYGR